uniref:Uncharacterized protein n=1 Tax=Brassica oleracea var. oleracea TaxID=109376 RepID=A0A0D3BSI9_BRAOL
MRGDRFSIFGEFRSVCKIWLNSRYVGSGGLTGRYVASGSKPRRVLLVFVVKSQRKLRLRRNEKHFDEDSNENAKEDLSEALQVATYRVESWLELGRYVETELCACSFAMSLTIPHEFFWEQSTKVNNSGEGSTYRPKWSAITLGGMLTDAPVSHKACGNSIPFTVHEHSPDVFVFLSGFSEEHPQYVGVISFFEWLMQRNPEDSLLEIFLFLFISPLFRCFATFSFLLVRVLPVETLSSSIGSSLLGSKSVTTKSMSE